MGDLEQYEVNALRRDRELDIYYDWLANFPHKAEPRITLLSWLNFEVHCPSCGRDVIIVKRGEHSYEGDCEHVFDRQGVDEDWDYRSKQNAYEEAIYKSQLVDCPVHLIKVPEVDWYRDYSMEALKRGIVNVSVLACKCRIVEEPLRKPCPFCPRLDKRGTMHARLVIKKFITAKAFDATQAYELECGHSTIDM